MQFLKDITNVAKTRKFWVAVVGFLVSYFSGVFTDAQWFEAVVSILTVFGVYQVPNQVGAVNRKR